LIYCVPGVKPNGTVEGTKIVPFSGS
jgi:hypothetical protein